MGRNVLYLTSVYLNFLKGSDGWRRVAVLLNNGERQPVIALIGPTAVGKTALSLDVAKKLNAEIVSVDSRQVYRYMDVGTDKAPASADQIGRASCRERV